MDPMRAIRAQSASNPVLDAARELGAIICLAPRVRERGPRPTRVRERAPVGALNEGAVKLADDNRPVRAAAGIASAECVG